MMETTMFTSDLPQPASAGLWTRIAMAAVTVMKAMRNWRIAMRNRREVQMLLDAEPGVLRDLGLSRMDVVAALSEPTWRDPSARLLIWSVERRAASRASALERRIGLAAEDVESRAREIC